MNRTLISITILSVTAVSVCADVVTEYRFEGNLGDTATGGAVADDLIPSFIGGTGAESYEPGVVGQAVRLDLFAEQAFVLTAEDSDDLDLTNDWTLEAFVKPDFQNAGEWDRFWTKWGEGSNDWHFAFRRGNNGEDYFMNGSQVFDGGTNPNDNSVPLNQWSHVAVVGDSAAAEVRGYLNGVEVVAGDYTVPIAGVSNMNFGNFAHGGNTNALQYTGLIDEALIHNVAVDDGYLQGRAALLPEIEPPDTSIAPPPATGLISYYTFDDTIDDVADGFSQNLGVVADDFQERGGDVNYETGQVGRALRIGVEESDVTDLSAAVSADVNLPETYTIEAWVFPTELDDSWQRLVLNWGADERGYHFAIRNNSGFNNAVSLFHEQADGAQPNANGGTVELEEWQHIAGVADGGTLSVYLNGELVGETRYDGTINTTQDEGLGIADSDTALSNIKYNGLVDDLAIWSVPLTARQIRFQYQQGLLGNSALTGGLVGDFDGSGELDVADIDLLSAEARSETHNAIFDLTGDGLVDRKDRIEWVENLKKTFLGDSNLDGEFNSSDFVAVFTAGEYEDGVVANSTWASGDWNGDAEFDSSDFVIAFVSGGYEVGRREAAQPVPEPSNLIPLWLGLAGCFCGMRHRSTSVQQLRKHF